MPHLTADHARESVTLAFGVFLVLGGLVAFGYVGYRLDRKLRADAQVPVQLKRIADALGAKP